jgi:hypothetical protein
MKQAKFSQKDCREKVWRGLPGKGLAGCAWQGREWGIGGAFLQNSRRMRSGAHVRRLSR